MASKLKENLIAFIIAIFLTWWVILAINSSSNLATDILGTKNTAKITSDLSLVYKDKSLEVVSNKNIPNVLNLTLELSFNKDKVQIKREDIDSSYSISSSDNGWNYTIILQNIWELKKWSILFKINNITKEQFDNINLWHIQVIDNNWKILDLTSSK